MTERKKQLLKQFHTILSKNGLMKHKPDLLASAGVESSKSLSENQLIAFINDLNGDSNKWRKRVMASIGGWLASRGITNGNGELSNADLIKSIACRATGYKSFNEIPASRLRDTYYGFGRKATAAKGCQDVQVEIENALSNLN